MFLDNVIKILDNAVALDVGLSFDFGLNSEISNKIIELNTIGQLYEQGVDSKDNSLGLYSDFTIETKIFKNERFDHVTLKDTGSFYNSFKVTSDRGEITITANDVADYDIPLTAKYGKDIIGLTDESLQIIIEMIRPRIIQYVHLKLCA
jgi:hypothetical protein